MANVPIASEPTQQANVVWTTKSLLMLKSESEFKQSVKMEN